MSLDILKSKKLILICGFRKCGTTSLYDLIVNKYPESACLVKEPQLINGSEDLNEEVLLEYAKLFNLCSDVWVDGSTLMVFSNEAIEFLKKYFLDVKVVVCVRDPVKRFISSYWHSKGKAIPQENKSIEHLVSEVYSHKGDRIQYEVEATSDSEFYSRFYSESYLRDMGVSNRDYKPKYRFMPFMYFSEGCYSIWLDKLQCEYFVVVFEELVRETQSCLKGISEYIEIEVDGEGLPESNASYVKNGFIGRLSDFGFIKSHIPVSLKNKLKSYLFSKPEKTSSEVIVMLKDIYKDEINYWAKNNAVRKYWN
jgi:hypothetical protein